MALARALAVEPKVLLLDEPFGALDARVRKELREWLRRLHEEVHVTTVLVTHDQEEAMEVADRVVVMNKGRIEQVGTPRELYEQPANEFVMSFVGPVDRAGRRAACARTTSSCSLEPNGTAREATSSESSTWASRCASSWSSTTASRLSAQATREQADELGLRDGQTLYVGRARRRRSPVWRSFGYVPGAPGSSTTAWEGRSSRRRAMGLALERRHG